MNSDDMDFFKGLLVILGILLGAATFITFVIVVAVLILHNAGVGT